MYWRCTHRSRLSSTLCFHRTERRLHRHHMTAHRVSGMSRVDNQLEMHSQVRPVWSTTSSFHRTDKSFWHHLKIQHSFGVSSPVKASKKRMLFQQCHPPIMRGLNVDQKGFFCVPQDDYYGYLSRY